MGTDLQAQARAPDTTGIGRFGTRALLGWAAMVLGAVPFLSLWLLVQRSWPPLAALDGDVATALNEAVSGSALLVRVLQVVTDLGGTTVAGLLLTLAAAFLLVRRQHRLAAFVATTGLGSAVLVPVTKAIADRARPVLHFPVVETPSNASYPSGHATTAMVTWGVLLLIALPSVRRRTRPWLVAAAVALILLIGSTRLALGVHFVSDVLAGWALGAGWLAVTAAAFRGWQHDRGESRDQPVDPLLVPPAEAAHLVAGQESEPDQGLPDHRAAALRLVGVAVALFVLISGLGLLVSRGLTETWLGRFDRSAVVFFVDLRSPELTPWMEAVSTLSGARTVIALGLALSVLGLAVAANWRPVVFVVVAIVGEVAVYLTSAQVVGRVRPAVADLTTGLPAGASWPSGHAAAAMAIYGAAAALVAVYGRGRLRWAVVALPVLLAPAIGISRVYVAAHHPTDVLAGLLIGGVWVYACALVLLPAPGTGSPAGIARQLTPAAGGRQQ